MPPDRNAPTGTSESNWRFTACDSNRSSSCRSFRGIAQPVALSGHARFDASTNRPRAAADCPLRRCARERYARTGSELSDSFPDRPGRRHIRVPHECRQRTAIDRPAPARMGHKCLELGRKYEIGADPAIKQGFFAEPIATQGQSAVVRIPDREREHSVEPLQRSLDAPASNGVEQCLGVGMPLPVRCVRPPSPVRNEYPDDCRFRH